MLAALGARLQVSKPTCSGSAAARMLAMDINAPEFFPGHFSANAAEFVPFEHVEHWGTDAAAAEVLAEAAVGAAGLLQAADSVFAQHQAAEDVASAVAEAAALQLAAEEWAQWCGGSGCAAAVASSMASAAAAWGLEADDGRWGLSTEWDNEVDASLVWGVMELQHHDTAAVTAGRAEPQPVLTVAAVAAAVAAAAAAAPQPARAPAATVPAATPAPVVSGEKVDLDFLFPNLDWSPSTDASTRLPVHCSQPAQSVEEEDLDAEGLAERVAAMALDPPDQMDADVEDLSQLPSLQQHQWQLQQQEQQQQLPSPPTAQRGIGSSFPEAEVLTPVLQPKQPDSRVPLPAEVRAEEEEAQERKEEEEQEAHAANAEAAAREADAPRPQDPLWRPPPRSPASKGHSCQAPVGTRPIARTPTENRHSVPPPPPSEPPPPPPVGLMSWPSLPQCHSYGIALRIS